jgi:hypothetical protein
VTKTLNSQRNRTIPEALQDPVLAGDLLDLLANNAVLEIALVDPNTNEILSGSSPDRRGLICPPYPDFRELVVSGSQYEKWQILRNPDGQSLYQLEQLLGTPPNITILSVRAIISPALLHRGMSPVLLYAARAWFLFVLAPICITLLLSVSLLWSRR